MLVFNSFFLVLLLMILIWVVFWFLSTSSSLLIVMIYTYLIIILSLYFLFLKCGNYDLYHLICRLSWMETVIYAIFDDIILTEAFGHILGHL